MAHLVLIILTMIPFYGFCNHYDRDKNPSSRHEREEKDDRNNFWPPDMIPHPHPPGEPKDEPPGEIA